MNSANFIYNTSKYQEQEQRIYQLQIARLNATKFINNLNKLLQETVQKQVMYKITTHIPNKLRKMNDPITTMAIKNSLKIITQTLQKRPITKISRSFH